MNGSKTMNKNTRHTPEPRLVAAAPELLEALRETADYLATFFEEGRAHRVVIAADMAIAKAEGN
jgi:hypothetical protein